ncbi:response regulator transcription factor [Martelella mangrovi]|uniref:response regulator transcription factor n=1 Tax=Martelella mangrovi TaxID=1397477 RepID=UPI0033973CB0
MAIDRIRKDGDRPLLSARELECLKWAAEGKTEWEIAQILTISESTVDKHLTSVNKKLGVHSRPHAVAEAFRRALIH